jgi:cobalt-precorrin 5A hydrolase
MELCQSMIVAGFGCRKGIDAAEVVAAYRAALHRYGVDRVAFLAAPSAKREEEGLQEAAERLGLALQWVETEDLARYSSQVLTSSTRVASALGIASVSEAAALHAAGTGSSLLGPRIAVGRVTCALAKIEDKS